MIITVAHFNTGEVDYLKIDTELEETIENVEEFLISLGYNENEIILKYFDTNGSLKF